MWEVWEGFGGVWRGEEYLERFGGYWRVVGGHLGLLRAVSKVQ